MKQFCNTLQWKSLRRLLIQFVTPFQLLQGTCARNRPIYAPLICFSIGMSLAMDAEGFSPRGTVEGSVAGHPAILGGLSSDPVASHLLGIQTCSPYCIGHDFNGRCSNGQCDSGLLLGSSDGCCETPGGLVCGSFFVLAPSRIRVGYTGTSRFGEGNGVQIFDRRFGILPSHFIFIAEFSSPNFHPRIFITRTFLPSQYRSAFR